MKGIVWNIPSERAYERLDELNAYIEKFPEGELASAVREEIAYLESLLEGRKV